MRGSLRVLSLLNGTGIKYFPFPGDVTGHPSNLGGTVSDIVASAKELASKAGVHGLDLLAYRSSEDIDTLMAEVCAATDKPVVIAGSIDTRERVSDVKESGAAWFTIGTAALDGNYLAEGTDLDVQLRAILRDVAEINSHISDTSTKNRVDRCLS